MNGSEIKKKFSGPYDHDVPPFGFFRKIGFYLSKANF